MSLWSPPVVCRCLPSSAPNHSPHLSLLLPPPPSSSIHHLALFSWSTTDLTTAVTSTAGHIFHPGTFLLSRHNLPFTLPWFLGPPEADSSCRLGPLPVVASLLSATSHHLQPSSALSHRCQCHLTPCHGWGDESCRHGWFTRRSSTTCAGLPPATVIAISQVPPWPSPLRPQPTPTKVELSLLLSVSFSSSLSHHHHYYFHLR